MSTLSPLASLSSETIRILHVDDEPDFADLTATYLQREDARFSIETAANASEGLGRLADEQFDCIISDYDMPGQNGIEFLDAVREDNPDLPFILFTGKGSEEVASDAISAGVTDYLQKEPGTDQYTVLANRVSNAIERHQSRRMIERSEKRLRNIIDELPHLLYVIDEDGTYLLANEVLAEFHGTSVDVIEGAHVTEVLDDPEAQQFLNDLTDVLDSGASKQVPEVEIADPDGRIHIFEPRLLPYNLADTETRTVLGIAVDVTERQQREQELKVKTQRLDAILDNTTTPMFMKNADGRHQFVNHGYRDLFGLHDETIVGRTDYDLHPSAVADEVWGNGQTVIERGEPLEIEERVFVDGEERIFLSSKVPIYDTGERSDPDEPVAVFGVASEITELRRHEEQLQRERDRLDEFAGVVSHDLRTPLSVAEGRLELAQEECDSEHLDAIETALERINRITGDALWLAREGRDIGSLDAVAVQDAVDSVWTLVADDADKAELEYVDDELESIAIEADYDRLCQLLENLLGNAIEHGGGDVTVSVGTMDYGFYIEDDGPGIPDDQRDDVFTTGYSNAEDGTGFGLSIVKQIAEAHGWDTRVTEGIDGGARFEITGVEFIAE